MKRTCMYCGRTFEIERSPDSYRWRSHFCNSTCYHNYRDCEEALEVQPDTADGEMLIADIRDE